MTKLKIKGMTCNHCVMAVTKALKEIEGLEDVSVNLEKGEAVFNEGKPVDKKLVEEKIRKAGFELVN